MSAVAFATILAVVAGILLSASAAVAHDIYARVIRRGDIEDSDEVRISRIATVVIGAIAVSLSLLVKGHQRRHTCDNTAGDCGQRELSRTFPCSLLEEPDDARCSGRWRSWANRRSCPVDSKPDDLGTGSRP